MTYDPYSEITYRNGWWIEDFCQEYYASRLTYRVRNQYKTTYVDNKLSYCTKCERVWEKHPYTHGTRSETEYYDILPRVGKKDKTCENCD